MNIDKSKLQPLLWAVVGAWNAGDQDLHLRTDALDAFLGETTVEEVALSLLAEIKKLEAAKHTVECRFEVSEDTLSTIRGCLREAESDIDQLKAENEKMRSFLAEVSRTSGDKWAVMAARNLLEDVDHG